MGGIVAFAAIVSLSGVLASFNVVGFSEPTSAEAANGQTPVTRAVLRYRYVGGLYNDMLALGENKSAGGIFVQNQTIPSQCSNSSNEFKVPTNGGERVGSTIDKDGNIYLVWQESVLNIGFQVHFARISADCTSTTGSIVLGTQIAEKYAGVTFSNGTPDIAYSSAENRIYVAYQGGLNGDYERLQVVSAVANPTGWGNRDVWDKFWDFGRSGATQVTPHIVADKNNRVHVSYRSGATGALRTIFLTGGANGSWNVSAASGGTDVSQDGSWNVNNINMSIAPDGTAYATWVSPGNGNASVGLARYNPPPANNWQKVGDNVINSDSGSYSGLLSQGVAAGFDNKTVTIGTGTKNPDCATLYVSTNRGASFTQKFTAACYSSEASEVSIAQGYDQVCVFAKEAARINQFKCVNGIGGKPEVPLVTRVTSPAANTTFIIPTNSPTFDFQVTWQKDVITGSGGPVNYFVDYCYYENSCDSAASAGWRPISEIGVPAIGYPTQATSGTVRVPGYKLVYFRVRGQDVNNATLNELTVPHPTADTYAYVLYPPITTTMTALPATINTTPASAIIPNLSWSGTGGKTSALLYSLEVSDGNNGPWVVCKLTVPATSLAAYPTNCDNPAAVPAVQSGHTYRFRVSAFDGVVYSYVATAPAQTSTHVVFPILSSWVSPTAAATANTTSLALSWGGSGGDVNPVATFAGQLPSLLYSVQYQDITVSPGTWNNVVTNSAATTANLTVIPGHTYQFRVRATDNISTETYRQPFDAQTTIVTGAPIATSYNGCTVVRINLVQNIGDIFTHFQVSNNGTTWSAAQVYNAQQTNFLWNLADPAYGGQGSGVSGNRQVFVRYSSNGAGGPYGGAIAITNIPAGGNSFNTSGCGTLPKRFVMQSDTAGGDQNITTFFNPGPKDAAVMLTYSSVGNGTPNPVDLTYNIKAGAHLSINSPLGGQQYAIQIISDGTVYADDTVYGPNGFDGIESTTTTANTWYFPDSRFIDNRTISYDVFNPDPVNPVNATIDFLGSDGLTVLATQTTSVPKLSRVVIFNPTSTSPAAGQPNVAVRITAPGNIIAGQTIKNGSGRISTILGQANGSQSSAWYFPAVDLSGTTNNSTISLWNPGLTDTTVRFSLYPAGGGPAAIIERTLGGNRMQNLSLRSLLASAPGVDPANLTQGMLKVTSTTPIFTQLSQVNGPAASGALGAMRGMTTSANSWYISDSPVNLSSGMPSGATDTLYLANFDTTDAVVTISAFDDNGNQVCTSGCNITVQSGRRATISAASLGGLNNKRVSFSIQSTGGKLIVAHQQGYSNDIWLAPGQSS